MRAAARDVQQNGGAQAPPAVGAGRQDGGGHGVGDAEGGGAGCESGGEAAVRAGEEEEEEDEGEEGEEEGRGGGALRPKGSVGAYGGRCGLLGWVGGGAAARGVTSWGGCCVGL